MSFRIEPTANPKSDADRKALLEAPAFGRVFTDHMLTMRYTADKGWSDGVIAARAPLAIDPAAAVLHYAQEIFEGMKAYWLADGTAALFRPQANAARFNRSARRMAMPELPEEAFVEGIKQFVALERDWIPSGDGASLYLRPFMFATEAFLGVRPAREYLFAIIASPAGSYFKSGSAGLRLFVSHEHVRAAPGGTGEAKCGGNYAGGLVAQSAASEAGCDQVLFLDAREQRWIEELGGMNIMFVFDDGSMVTPPLGGTILPGITRDSLLRLARDAGVTVREEPYSIDQLKADAASGRLVEAFACGTAAVVSSIATFVDGDAEISLPAATPVTTQLKSALQSIYAGTAEDRHGWLTRIG